MSSGLLEFAQSLPMWARPMGLKRGSNVLLLVLAILNISDIADSILAIGIECSRHLSDAERVMSITAQIACKFSSSVNLIEFCETGAWLAVMSDFITFLIIIYGFIVLSTAVPQKQYVIYLSGLITVRGFEELFNTVKAWSYWLGGAISDNSNHICYNKGLKQSPFLIADDSHGMSIAVGDAVAVQTMSFVFTFLLLFVLLVLIQDLNRGGKGESLIANEDVMSLIAAPTPSLLLSTSMFNRPISSASALIACGVGLVSIGQIFLCMIRFLVWCPHSLKLEHSVCAVYAPLVFFESLGTAFLAGYLVIYLLITPTFKRLTTYSTLVAGSNLFVLINAFYGLSLNGKYYPSMLLQGMYLDYIAAGTKFALLIALNWTLYSLRMLRIAGGTCREPVAQAELIVTTFSDQQKDSFTEQQTAGLGITSS